MRRQSKRTSKSEAKGTLRITMMRFFDDTGHNQEQRWQQAVQATTGLLRIFSFPDFFNATAESLAKLLDADGVALIVYDSPGRLRYKLFHGLETLNQTPIVKFSFPAEQGTVGRGDCQ